MSASLVNGTCTLSYPVGGSTTHNDGNVNRGGAR
jgi:hypothetical protein